MKRGKKYVEAVKLYDKNTRYSLADAVELVKKTNLAKFDATVEVAVRLNIDPRQAEQNLRGTISLPNGTGRVQRVAVVAQGEFAKQATEAGADHVGDADLIEKISKGWFEFDVMIATPDMMPQLGKLGRVLGPKGLMPNPKTGTVTTDIKTAVTEFKQGKIEYRTDKVGNIHLPVGKISFDNKKLAENIVAVYKLLLRVKPATVKGTYLKNFTVSSTMGPGIKVDSETIK